jgi:holo-[acyl-carrier protein] synthase
MLSCHDYCAALDKPARDAISRSRSPGRRIAAMILGIGSDLANIERIERTIARFGTRFLDRVYTGTEQALAERRRERVATYAKRWAAKEACSKALGTGLRMGIKWRDMGVVNLRSGQPTLQLTGWAEERLRAMTPPGHRAHVHLTLTDDHPWAMAGVVIEALPEA